MMKCILKLYKKYEIEPYPSMKTKRNDIGVWFWQGVKQPCKWPGTFLLGIKIQSFDSCRKPLCLIAASILYE